MRTDMEMPRYKCHKEVWALQIRKIAVHKTIDGKVTKVVLTPDDDLRYAPFEVSVEWWFKHNPSPLGYYVVYEDGYRSWSPTKAFEEGYTLCE